MKTASCERMCKELRWSRNKGHQQHSERKLGLSSPPTIFGTSQRGGHFRHQMAFVRNRAHIKNYHHKTTDTIAIIRIVEESPWTRSPPLQRGLQERGRRRPLIIQQSAHPRTDISCFSRFCIWEIVFVLCAFICLCLFCIIMVSFGMLQTLG